MKNSRWVGAAVGRLLGHAVMGGLIFGVVGGWLMGSEGAFWGWLLFQSNPLIPHYIEAGAVIGAALGGFGGFAVGGASCAIIGLVWPMRSLWEPDNMIARVFFVMAGATLASGVSFGLFCTVLAYASGQGLLNVIDDYLLLVMIVSPLAMVLTQIWGLVWSYHLERTRALS